MELRVSLCNVQKTATDNIFVQGKGRTSRAPYRGHRGYFALGDVARFPGALDVAGTPLDRARAVGLPGRCEWHQDGVRHVFLLKSAGQFSCVRRSPTHVQFFLSCPAGSTKCEGAIASWCGCRFCSSLRPEGSAALKTDGVLVGQVTTEQHKTPQRNIKPTTLHGHVCSSFSVARQYHLGTQVKLIAITKVLVLHSVGTNGHRPNPPPTSPCTPRTKSLVSANFAFLKLYLELQNILFWQCKNCNCSVKIALIMHRFEALQK